MPNKEIDVPPQSYLVTSGATIRLSVTIGQAQLGASLALLDDEELEACAFDCEIIGTGAEVAGRTLRILTMVSDVRRQTNRTSVKYELTGGAEPLRFGAEETVDEEGDMALYSAKIDFMEA